MKTVFKVFLPLVLFVVFFASCEEKETNVTPEIKSVSAINHDNNTSTIKRGGTISVNFDAKSRSGARLDFYHIEIHDHPESGKVEDEYKIIDDDFKNKSTFKGLLNAHVHEHIVVPDTANLGAYHVVIVVVDENGNSADTEGLETSITIVE